MAQWVYKATTTKATFADTRDLAIVDHFLCRSAFEPGRNGLRKVARAWDVALGDFIHFFYRIGRGAVSSLGTFVVVDGRSVAPHFQASAGPPAIFAVDEETVNAAFLKRLRRGYKHDLDLKAFTGWVLKPAPSAVRTPPYDATSLFPAPRITLWRYPDPELPR